MRISGFLCLTTSLLAFASPDVDARKGLGSLFKVGRAVKAIDGAKIYGSGTLTVEQLAACLLSEQEIHVSDETLNFDRGLIDEKEVNLKSMEGDILYLKRYLESNKDLELTIQQQVDIFNAKADSYNGLISAYNSEVGSLRRLESGYNSSVQEHNSLVNHFQSDCAGKLYYEDDFVAAHRLIH